MSLAPCIFCGAPWEHPDADIDHKPDCAQVTGLYPVLDQDLGPHGFCCSACLDPFALGDFYTLRDLGWIHAVVCLGCEALERPLLPGIVP